MQPRAVRGTGQHSARLSQPELPRAPRPTPPPRQKRAVVRRHWLSALVVASGMMAAILTTRSFVIQEWKLRAIRAEAASVEVQLQQVRARNDALKDEIVRLNTPEYIETVAREQLGLIKQGEIPYMTQNPSGNSH